MMLTTIIMGLFWGMLAQAQAQPSPVMEDEASARITALRAAMAKDPQKAMTRVDLAILLADRARYTFDPQVIAETRKVVAPIKSDPAYSFLSLKVETQLLLVEQKYAEALKESTALNRKMPDDVDVYGFMVEALLALGRVDEAEKQGNWMLRLRKNHRQSLRRTAELREAFGDIDGVLLALNDLYRVIPASDSMERAWVLGRMARHTSDRKRAELLARQAVKLHPESYEGKLALEQILNRAGE